MANLTKKIKSATIVENACLEITFSAELSPLQVEEGHGQHEVGDMWLVELEKVEQTVAGKTIDVLTDLTEAQKMSIVRSIEQNHIDNLINAE